jgi:hypothetical protein
MSNRLIAACLALLLPIASQAQWVPGIGEDASLPRPGVVRFGVGFDFSDFDRRFSRAGDNTIEPLGADFNAVTLDRLPSGSVAQDGIRALAGIPNLTLTLGDLDVRMRGAVERYPMTLELGLLRRLALTLTVPIVRTRTTVAIGPDIGSGADAGLNPALILPAALTTNTALAIAIGSASAQLRDRLAECDGSSAPECDPVNADRSAAESFAANAESFGDNLAAVYVSGMYVPVVASAADAAIVARLDAIRAQFDAYGIGSLAGAPLRPVAAGPMTHDDLQSFVTSNAFGILSDPFATVERTSLGDIETGAKILLIDRVDPGGRRAAGMRLLVGGLVRFGTGSPEVPRNLLDIGTGDGQTDIEASAILDLVAGSRIALTARARYTRQLEAELLMRVPEVAGQPFVPAFREATIARDLGDIVTFEAVPRIAVHDLMSIAGYFSYFNKRADTHRTVQPGLIDTLLPPLTFDASPLDAGTAIKAQRIGVGVAYSNLAAHRRGRARFPYEISYLHLRTTKATGGIFPRSTEDRIQLKVYVPLWGR